MSKTEHTPLPWGAEYGVTMDIWIGSESNNVCCIPGYPDHPQNVADAEFIVRAVNSHADLIEALRVAKQFIENGFELGYIATLHSEDPARETLPKIHAALAKATQGGGDA